MRSRGPRGLVFTVYFGGLFNSFQALSSSHRSSASTCWSAAAFDAVRKKVWARQPAEFFTEAHLDADSTLVGTSGDCRQVVRGEPPAEIARRRWIRLISSVLQRSAPSRFRYAVRCNAIDILSGGPLRGSALQLQVQGRMSGCVFCPVR